MVKFVRLKLTNFQSHKSSTIEFSPGLNSIVGPSDSGKTAIWRSLRYLLFNEPRLGVSNFIRIGESDFVVELETDQGIITRTKGSKNSFYLEERNSSTLDLQKIGTGLTGDPLRKLQRISGVWPAELDGEGELLLNLSDQLDRPFLLFEQGVQAGRIFSRLGPFSKIDSVNKSLVSDRRKLQIENSKLEKDISILESQLEKYKDFESREFELSELDYSLSRAKKLEKRVEELNSLSQMLSYTYSSLRDLREINQIDIDFSNLIKSLNKLKHMKNVVESVSNIRREWSQIQSFPSIDLNMLNLLKEKLNKLKTLFRLFDSISSLNSEILNIEDNLNVIECNILVIKEELDSVRGSISVCPVCGK